LERSDGSGFTVLSVANGSGSVLTKNSSGVQIGETLTGNMSGVTVVIDAVDIGDIENRFIDLRDINGNHVIRGVSRIVPIESASGTSNGHVFDARYHATIDALYTINHGGMLDYSIAMSNLTLLDQVLRPRQSVRFNKAQGLLYVDMDWEKYTPGD
jgi:alpha-D-ribose 1-methylphosphonate 5-triphosphate diphosphatase PhnM